MAVVVAVVRQNDSESTTRALQGHFPTGRSWGIKSHHFSPEAVGSGEETKKKGTVAFWIMDVCVICLGLCCLRDTACQS